MSTIVKFDTTSKFADKVTLFSSPTQPSANNPNPDTDDYSVVVGGTAIYLNNVPEDQVDELFSKSQPGVGHYADGREYFLWSVSLEAGVVPFIASEKQSESGNTYYVSYDSAALMSLLPFVSSGVNKPKSRHGQTVRVSTTSDMAV